MADDDDRTLERPGSRATSYQGYTRQTEGMAVAALVCAILSWITIPVILAIVALILAGIAERRIHESRGAYTGEGLVSAARIIAWINLALAALLLLLLIAGIVLLIIV